MTKRKVNHPPDEHLIKSKNNPYHGIMALGWEDYHRGKPNYYADKPPPTKKAYAWRQGWVKAKLAEEQGKTSL